VQGSSCGQLSYGPEAYRCAHGSTGRQTSQSTETGKNSDNNTVVTGHRGRSHKAAPTGSWGTLGPIQQAAAAGMSGGSSDALVVCQGQSSVVIDLDLPDLSLASLLLRALNPCTLLDSPSPFPSPSPSHHTSAPVQFPMQGSGTGISAATGDSAGIWALVFGSESGKPVNGAVRGVGTGEAAGEGVRR